MANVITLEQLARKIERLGPDAEAATLRGIQSAALKLEGMIPQAIATASPSPPSDTGELARSHYSVDTPTGALVGMDAPHAPFMEYGTRPHKPPSQPIADWAFRKGIVDAELEFAELWTAEDVNELSDVEKDAYWIVMNIVNAIAINGIEPRRFMFNALQQFLREDILGEEIQAELEAML